VVKRITIDPGKKPPFKPEHVALEGERGVEYTPTFLERLLLEREKDPNTLLPEGMTLGSLKKLVAREREKTEALIGAGGGGTQQMREPPEYIPPSDEQLQSRGIESERVRNIVGKWRRKAK